MSDVNCKTVYDQLQQIVNAGNDLANYVIVDCDTFADEAIIIKKGDDNED